MTTRWEKFLPLPKNERIKAIIHRTAVRFIIVPPFFFVKIKKSYTIVCIRPHSSMVEQLPFKQLTMVRFHLRAHDNK